MYVSSNCVLFAQTRQMYALGQRQKKPTYTLIGRLLFQSLGVDIYLNKVIITILRYSQVATKKAENFIFYFCCELIRKISRQKSMTTFENQYVFRDICELFTVNLKGINGRNGKLSRCPIIIYKNYFSKKPRHQSYSQ